MKEMQLPEGKDRTDEQAEIRAAKLDANFEYHDILYAEPPILPDHPRMDRISRAAQFAPFAALPVFDAFGMETEDGSSENGRKKQGVWTE